MKLNDTFFGSWKIDRRIGQGSYGSVYRLKKSDLGETYYSAMKVISVSENDLTDEFIKEIKNEISLMSRLKGHSNIVSFEDYEVVFAEEGGAEILIRMEHLEPLLKHEKNHIMTNNDIIQLGLDMCSALELCENNSMLHRDIKPENIFISANGDYKLGDFGIARTIEKNCTFLSRKGTFAYMAPEVYKGENYDTTADIYSLGIVLYRCMNGGCLPFIDDKNANAEKREEKTKLRLGGEPLPVLEDSELMNVIMKACEYDPRNRYKNASEMKEALLKAKASSEKKDNILSLLFTNDAFLTVLKVLVGLGITSAVILILILIFG